MSFAAAIRAGDNQTSTENGMPAFKSTLNACVDLFFKIGALRKAPDAEVLQLFFSAYNEEPEVALRIAAYARDARGGMGERRVFRVILQGLEARGESEAAKRLLVKAPEWGRWDDVLVMKSPALKNTAFEMIARALVDRDRLVAKWLPREKNASKERSKTAREIASFLGIDARAYRRLVVGLTHVVETQMCAKSWDEIVYSAVPSVAQARYRKAFAKHDAERYNAFLADVKEGKQKINASAVFPHDVIKPVVGYGAAVDATLRASVVAQWEALENFVGDNYVMPLIDTSGSMGCNIGAGTSTAMDVAVALGLYFADKNKGPFKDVYLTFSDNPSLKVVPGDIVDKVKYLWGNSDWGGSTNIEAAFKKLLSTAVAASLPVADMPKTLLIMSDMQFNSSVRDPGQSAYTMVQRMYEEAGYAVPQVVFWNLNARENVPVTFDTRGVALLSGYSPAVVKAVLKGADFTPMTIMLDSISGDRYNF